jgi:hypothetical protein
MLPGSSVRRCYAQNLGAAAVRLDVVTFLVGLLRRLVGQRATPVGLDVVVLLFRLEPLLFRHICLLLGEMDTADSH